MRNSSVPCVTVVVCSAQASVPERLAAAGELRAGTPVGLTVVVSSCQVAGAWRAGLALSLIHISEPTRHSLNSYAAFCLKKKKVA
ncbi:hypothetical protein GTU99_07450, partial [Streptomyces sp. PRKS01-65]